MAKKRKLPPVRIPVAYTSYRLKPKEKIKALGITKFGKKQILISKDVQEPGRWANTFWHEWMHAVTHEGGYDSRNDNEAFVEFMAIAISRMFTDPVSRMMLEKMLKTMS